MLDKIPLGFKNFFSDVLYHLEIFLNGNNEVL